MPIVMRTLYAVKFWMSAGSTSVAMTFVTFTTNVIRLPITGGEAGSAPTWRARTPIRIQTRTCAIRGVAAPPPSSTAWVVAIRGRRRPFRERGRGGPQSDGEEDDESDECDAAHGTPVTMNSAAI